MVTQLGDANSYMLFGKNGIMQRNKRVHVHKGTKIFAHGYAMSLQYFVVYDENMNAVEICNGDPNDVDEFCLERYYSPIIKVGEETRPVSEVYGIGLYYDESDEIISDEIIEKSLQRAKNIERMKQEKADKEQREWNEAVERLAKEFNYLERAENKYDRKVVGKNIRTQLKREFPGVKFSVKKESYDCYRISWTDGPTDEAVTKITSRYDTGRFDAYQDYHYSQESPFTSLFGGVDYIFTQREISDAAIEETRKRFPGLTAENYNRGYQYGIEGAATLAYQCSSLDDFIYRMAHRLDFMPEVKEKPAKVENSGDVQIIDYSEKSIAVIGDSREFYEQLKAIGGAWNKFKKCWFFSKKKRAEVEALLSI